MTTRTPARRKFISIGGGLIAGMPLRFCRETTELSHGDRATDKNSVFIDDKDDIQALIDASQVGDLSVPWAMFVRYMCAQMPDSAHPHPRFADMRREKRIHASA